MQEPFGTRSSSIESEHDDRITQTYDEISGLSDVYIFVSASVRYCLCNCARCNVLREMKNQLNCRNCVRSSYPTSAESKEKSG